MQLAAQNFNGKWYCASAKETLHIMESNNFGTTKTHTEATGWIYSTYRREGNQLTLHLLAGEKDVYDMELSFSVEVKGNTMVLVNAQGQSYTYIRQGEHEITNNDIAAISNIMRQLHEMKMKIINPDLEYQRVDQYGNPIGN